MFQNLNQREKLFVMGGAALLGLLLLFFVIRSVVKKRAELSDGVILAREQLNGMMRLKDDISSLPPPGARPDMNTFKSEVYKRMENNGLSGGDIRDHIENVSRTEEKLVLDLNMKGVSLSNVITFLHDVEYRGGGSGEVEKFFFYKPLPGREIYDVKITLAIRRPKSGR